MVFVELALFGIRHFQQLARFTFKPGINRIEGGNGSGKSTVWEVLLHLLSPTIPLPEDGFRARAAANGCQAGLVFRTGEGAVCRLVRDFAAQKISLSQMDPATRKFQLTLQEPDAIESFLSRQTGGCPSGVREGLFYSAPHRLPSSRLQLSNGTVPFESQSVSPIPTPAPADRAASFPAPVDRAEKKKRLDELKQLLNRGDQLAAMEDRLADFQSRQAEIQRRQRLASEKIEALKNLDHQGAALAAIGSLPEDVHLIMETSEQQEQLKKEQLAAIEEEAEALNLDLAGVSGTPFYRNKLFLGGAVLSGSFLILAAVMDLSGWLQHVFMAGLLGGIGLMGYVGFLDFSKLNTRRGIEARIREKDRQKIRLEGTFKKENAPFIELLKKTGSPDLAAMKTRIREHQQFLAARKELEGEKDQYLAGRTLENLREEAEKLSREIAGIEAELKSATMLPSDLYLIQEEARSLEKELAGPPPADPDPTERAVPVSVQPQAPKTDDDAFPDHSLRVALAAPGVLALLQPRRTEIQKRLAAWLSKGGGPAALDFGLDERLFPVPSSADASRPVFSRLSPGQKDYLHLSYQLVIASYLQSSFHHPLLLDDPFSRLDSTLRGRVLDILREIAQNRQVFLFSSARIEGPESDHLIQLN